MLGDDTRVRLCPVLGGPATEKSRNSMTYRVHMLLWGSLYAICFYFRDERKTGHVCDSAYIMFDARGNRPHPYMFCREERKELKNESPLYIGSTTG